MPYICWLDKKTLDGNTVQFHDKVRWIKITEYSEYEYRTTFSDTESWKKVNIMRDSDGDDCDALQLPSITSPQNNIKKAKYDDIQKQLKYVPSVHHDLYKKLTWA